MAHCIESVEGVLRKRELQHAILVGIELDELAEQGKLSAPLQQIVESDEGLFGVDETIALGAVFTYGSIAVTTFGHLDKNKIGIINELDTKKGEASIRSSMTLLQVLQLLRLRELPIERAILQEAGKRSRILHRMKQCLKRK